MTSSSSDTDREDQFAASGPRIERVAKPKLVRDATAESIRHAIIHGHLKPGERLIERELCVATGASRASVREAIRQLEADRLIEVTAHKGPAVARLTLEQAADIYELRAVLEARLVRAFCLKATDEDINRFCDLLGPIRNAAETRDKGALVEIMKRYNETMMATSGLEVTSDVLRSLLARISWLRFLSMTKPGRIEQSVGELAEIVRAIKRRDADDAAKATHIYIENAAKSALQQLASTML